MCFRRRNAERKLDLARVVINNLQDGEIADENYKNMNVNEMTNCNNRKSKKDKRKKNNKESYIEGDPMSGRNLLPQYAGYEDDEYILDYGECYREFPVCDNTGIPMPKTPEHVPTYGYVTRKNSSRSRENKYALARSRESSLDPDQEAKERAQRARRDFYHRRAKSGQWDPPVNRSLIYAPIPATLFSPSPRRICTQSAPDLVDLLRNSSTPSSAATSPDGFPAPPLPPPRPTPPRGSQSHMNKSATLGAPRRSGNSLRQKMMN